MRELKSFMYFQIDFSYFNILSLLVQSSMCYLTKNISSSILATLKHCSISHTFFNYLELWTPPNGFGYDSLSLEMPPPTKMCVTTLFKTKITSSVAYNFLLVFAASLTYWPLSFSMMPIKYIIDRSIFIFRDWPYQAF